MLTEDGIAKLERLLDIENLYSPDNYELTHYMEQALKAHVIFHRDRDYAHNVNEVNFWLPVTRAFDTNTIWIESEEGKEDFQPLECGVGESWMFNGCHLKHGNKINTTEQTRVSFDDEASWAACRAGDPFAALEGAVLIARQRAAERAQAELQPE